MLDWVVVIILVIAGLMCLTMSATSMMDTNSMGSYFTSFIQICMWIGIPIICAGILYFVVKWKRKK